MTFDVTRVREALADIPDGLITSRPQEPGWLSQAGEDEIFPVAEPVVISPARSASAEARQTPIVNRDTSDVIGNEVKESGVEALAWYRSFREPASVKWGIFIRAEGLRAVFDRMFAPIAAPPELKLRLAYRAVLAHELAHFYIDSAVSQWELMTRQALWWPRRRHFALKGTYDALEESIANAVMLRAVRGLSGELRVNGREKALRNWTRSQPRGYATGYRYTPDYRLNDALTRHGSLILRPAIHPAKIRRLVTLAPLVRVPLEQAIPSVPLYLVTEPYFTHFGDVGFFPAVQIVAETKGFKKQLDRVSPEARKSYLELKSRLATAAPVVADDLKKWRPRGKGAYSLRLNRGDRVHVQHLSGVQFEAIEIGSHSALGHG